MVIGLAKITISQHIDVYYLILLQIEITTQW